MRIHVCLTAVLALALAACHHDDAAPHENLAPPVATPAANAQTKGVQPSKDLSMLVQQLRYEAEHRPQSAVTADTIFDALAAHGVTLDGRHQYAGFTMRASYCAGGRTSEGIAVAVCEYPTADAAVAGKAYMDSAFAAQGATAQRAVHGDNVLTVAHPLGARYDDVASRAIATFASL